MKIHPIQSFNSIIHCLVITALLADFLMPKVASAGSLITREMGEINESNQLDQEPTFMADKKSDPIIVPSQEVKELIKPKKTIKMIFTAYSSTVDQTDNTPCITANGFNVCEHNQENIVAANFLPFGTKIKIPELYGDRIFTVEDRMHERYWYHVDIWLQTRERAQEFGVKYAVVEIY
jgi:3D (Asp-Asp-Asp) domain-containing protein